MERWQPPKRTLSGKVGEAVRFILRWSEQFPSDVLPFTTVREAIGATDAANFRRNVRKHPDLIEAVASAGIVATRQGYMRVAFGSAEPDV